MNLQVVFSCVRFGNVLGTRGSVIPLFLSQLRNSGPITLTHNKMTRFVMTLPTAVHLVLKAGELAKDGETFILRMPAIRIMDLIEVLNGQYAKTFDLKPVKIAETGIREGEKVHEDLLFSHEVNYASLNDEMIVVGFSRLGTEISSSLYRSEFAPYLNHDQIFELLQQIEPDVEKL